MSTDDQPIGLHGPVREHAQCYRLSVGVPIWRKDGSTPTYIDNAYRKCQKVKAAERKARREASWQPSKSAELKARREAAWLHATYARREMEREIIVREKGKEVYRESMIDNERGAQLF